MFVRGVGRARIRHSKTGRIYSISGDDLHWEAIDDEPRAGGTQTEYAASVDHPELGELRWTVWEYPEGAFNDRKTDVGSHLIIEDFNIRFRPDETAEDAEPDFLDGGQDEWIDDEPSDHPRARFDESYGYCEGLLSELGDPDLSTPFNRMVFTQHVTALEVYLGDTLKNRVEADNAAVVRLASNLEDLNKENFKLREIAKDPYLVQRKVRIFLSGILYHDLGVVNRLYFTAFGFNILTPVNRDDLLKAVQLRHDCVHRNGYDSEGKFLEVFTKRFVQDTAEKIRRFVIHVDSLLDFAPTSTVESGEGTAG